MYSTNSWWPWKVILPVESPLHLPFKILISKDLHIYSRILPWSFKCWSRFFCDRTIFVKGRLLPGAKITRDENDKIIFYTSNKGILLVKCNKNHNTTYLSFWKRICQVYIIHNLGYLKKCDIGTITFLLKFRPPPENLRFSSVRFSWGGGGGGGGGRGGAYRYNFTIWNILIFIAPVVFCFSHLCSFEQLNSRPLGNEAVANGKHK